jgi:FG-GAP repeat
LHSQANGVWALQARLQPNDLAADDEFGRAVAINGDTALVSANSSFPPGTRQGAVYVFVRSALGWNQQAKLRASDGTSFAFFGSALALTGNTALIAKRNASTLNDGGAYVFERSGGLWSEQVKLRANDQTALDGFGAAIALEADAIVVSAPRAEIAAASSAGAIYVYAKVGGLWQQQTKLVANDPSASALLGQALALSGNTILAGTGPISRSAYLFTGAGNSWSQQAKLLTPNPTNSLDDFGSAVALLGDTAIVGAPFHDLVSSGTFAGAVLVYARTAGTWAPVRKLTFPGAASYFGNAVAISEADLIVGAYNATNPSTGNANVGAAFVYANSESLFSNGFE